MSYVLGVYEPVSETPPENLVVLTSSLPTAYEGVAYNAPLQSSGGTGAVTWSIVAGEAALTALGLALVGNAITGTPTSTGSAAITIRATDSAMPTPDTADSGSLVLNVEAVPVALTVTTSSLPSVTRGQSYSATVNATGGTPPYSWALVAPNNVLPAGVTRTANALNATQVTEAGTFPLVFRVTDAAAASADSGVLNLTVNQVADLAIVSSDVLPQGEKDVVYPDRTLLTSGGWGAVTWSKLSGDYPAGISFNTSTGTFTGTPTAVETAFFRLRATDSEGRIAEKDFSFNVVATGTLEGPHDHFNYVASLPERQLSTSLRSTAAITAAGRTASVVGDYWTYDATVDAAKYYVVPVAPKYTWTAPGGAQLRFPISAPAKESVVVIFDWMWDPSFAEDFGEITHWKFCQMVLGGSGWWTLYHGNHAASVSGDPANVAMIYDQARESGQYVLTGATNKEPFVPAGLGSWSDLNGRSKALIDQFPMKKNTWTRYFVELRQEVPHTQFPEWEECIGGGFTLPANTLSNVAGGTQTAGAWHMASVWVADENREPVRIMYHMPIHWYTPAVSGVYASNKSVPTEFFFELNTSKYNATGPLTGWARNVNVLVDYVIDENDTAVFRKPVR